MFWELTSSWPFREDGWSVGWTCGQTSSQPPGSWWPSWCPLPRPRAPRCGKPGRSGPASSLFWSWTPSEEGGTAGPWKGCFIYMYVPKKFLIFLSQSRVLGTFVFFFLKEFGHRWHVMEVTYLREMLPKLFWGCNFWTLKSQTNRNT